MTATAWLALGAAASVVAGPSWAGPRAERLSGAGRLGQSGSAGRPSARRVPNVVIAAGSATIAVLAVTVAAGLPLGIAAAALAAVAWTLVRGALERRHQAAMVAELGTALGVLIGELEAGAGPAAALASAGAAGPHYASPFAAAAVEAAAGGEAGSVLRATPALQAIGLAWELGEQTGAALAGVLGRVAADLAAASTQRRAVLVALAGPRSSAALLTGLPLLGIALGSAMGAHPISFLVGPAPGSVLCCVGVLFDAAGVLWMRRILRRAAEP